MNKTCGCSLGCTCLAFILSLGIGVLAAIFRYMAVITVTPAFLWVLFGIAIGYLGITLLSGRPHQSDACECQTLTAFIVGALGTILTSIILLGITFAATSLIGALVTGALLFFFFYMIITTACRILCRCN